MYAQWGHFLLWVRSEAERDTGESALCIELDNLNRRRNTAEEGWIVLNDKLLCKT
jgi:hypothetical protein